MATTSTTDPSVLRSRQQVVDMCQSQTVEVVSSSHCQAHAQTTTTTTTNTITSSTTMIMANS